MTNKVVALRGSVAAAKRSSAEYMALQGLRGILRRRVLAGSSSVTGGLSVVVGFATAAEAAECLRLIETIKCRKKLKTT